MNQIVLLVIFLVAVWLLTGCQRYDPMPKWKGYELRFEQLKDR